MTGRATYLGEFEQVVLLAVARLEDEAYGANVRREIEERTGRAVSVGAAHATLNRLCDKKYLYTRIEPIERSGRRRRRIFVLAPAGVAALESARELSMRMWAGIQLRRRRRS